MKYICVNCSKPIDEKNIVMVPFSSGSSGTWTEPYCIQCYTRIQDNSAPEGIEKFKWVKIKKYLEDVK